MSMVRRPSVSVIARLGLVGILLLGVACSSDADDDGASEPDGTTTTEGTTATTPTTPLAPEPVEVATQEAFEAIPDPIPEGDHGGLLRYRRLPDPPAGTTTWRIMYLSTTVADEPTVVTGVVMVPTVPAPDDGWLLVSVGHGSTGLADDCSPSHSMETDDATAIDALAIASRLSATPAVVVISDYEGQGGPGRHPFLVAESEGRSVLDGARAARQLPDVPLVPDRLGLLGYSQGGHAVLAANERAGEWTPEAEVIGTVSGAPATELVDWARDLVRTPDGSYQAAVLLAGQAAADPTADLDAVLTDEGAAAIDALDRSCTEAAGLDGTAPALTIDPSTTAPWDELLRASEPGSVAGASPVLIIHSQEDRNVPVEWSEAYAERACAAGQDVERRILPTGDHVAAGATAYADGLAWLVARHGGDEAFSSSCP
jgi:dienelactone hydrolase